MRRDRGWMKMTLIVEKLMGDESDQRPRFSCVKFIFICFNVKTKIII